MCRSLEHRPSGKPQIVALFAIAEVGVALDSDIGKRCAAFDGKADSQPSALVIARREGEGIAGGEARDRVADLAREDAPIARSDLRPQPGVATPLAAEHHDRFTRKSRTGAPVDIEIEPVASSGLRPGVLFQVEIVG